jgi:hypothetical protein
MHCRAWYALPMLWLVVFAGTIVYVMYRGPEWEGWFAWLAPHGDPAYGDTIAITLIILGMMGMHKWLTNHIATVHAPPPVDTPGSWSEGT